MFCSLLFLKTSSVSIPENQVEPDIHPEQDQGQESEPHKVAGQGDDARGHNQG